MSTRCPDILGANIQGQVRACVHLEHPPLLADAGVLCSFDNCYWSHDRSHPDYASQEMVFKDLGMFALTNAFAVTAQSSQATLPLLRCI